MTTILTNLGHTIPNKMVISKFMYSLSLSHNIIIATWLNVSKSSQIDNYLKKCLFHYESLLQRQGSSNIETDYTFFIKSKTIPSPPINKRK